VISPDQMRMARAALKLGVRALAELAGVTPFTITRFENGRGGMQSGTMSVVIKALEAAGIEFISENGGGAGVRFKERAGE